VGVGVGVGDGGVGPGVGALEQVYMVHIRAKMCTSWQKGPSTQGRWQSSPTKMVHMVPMGRVLVSVMHVLPSAHVVLMLLL
jgi:hypothetical protein